MHSLQLSWYYQHGDRTSRVTSMEVSMPSGSDFLRGSSFLSCFCLCIESHISAWVVDFEGYTKVLTIPLSLVGLQVSLLRLANETVGCRLLLDCAAHGVWVRSGIGSCRRGCIGLGIGWELQALNLWQTDYDISTGGSNLGISSCHIGRMYVCVYGCKARNLGFSKISRRQGLWHVRDKRYVGFPYHVERWSYPRYYWTSAWSWYYC